MAIQLDPFHRIIAINCPEPAPEGITITAAGRMTVTEVGSTINLLCGGGAGPGAFGNYTYFPDWYLSAELIECNQFTFYIKGQTSGVTHYFGFYDELVAIPLDCADVFPAQCPLFTVPNQEMVLVRDGFWSVGDSRWAYTGSELISISDLGYIDQELIDVTIPDNAPSRTILSITQAGARPLVQVDADIEDDYHQDSWVTVSGTTNYNGNYQVVSPFGDLFLLETAYIADESSGATTPYYLQQVFFP